MKEHCAICKMSSPAKPCRIIAWAISLEGGLSRPQEWVADHAGKPSCTAFKDKRRPPKRELIVDKRQLGMSI